MKRNRMTGLWSDIRAIMESQPGRQAMMTTGAVIAGTYFGSHGPELFTSMHESIMLFSAKYPFMDPVDIASAVWGGAKEFAVSAVEHIAAIPDRFPEISHQLREAVQSIRDGVRTAANRTIDGTRDLFVDTAAFVGGYAAEVAATVRSAMNTGMEYVGKYWGQALGALAIAKEAYEYFETGDNIYKRWFKRAKTEVTGTPAEVNVSVNAAIAGAEVLEHADHQTRIDRTAASLNIDPEQIAWISQQIYDRLNAEGKIICNPKEADGQISSDAAPTKILKGPKNSLSTTAYSDINTLKLKKEGLARLEWSQSPASEQRMRMLQERSRRTPRPQRNMTDPIKLGHVRPLPKEKRITIESISYG